jgi:hypothetical protein
MYTENGMPAIAMKGNNVFKINLTNRASALGLIGGALLGFMIGETAIDNRVLKMILYPLIGGFICNAIQNGIENKIHDSYVKEREIENKEEEA